MVYLQLLVVWCLVAVATLGWACFQNGGRLPMIKVQRKLFTGNGFLSAPMSRLENALNIVMLDDPSSFIEWNDLKDTGTLKTVTCAQSVQ